MLQRVGGSASQTSRRGGGSDFQGSPRFPNEEEKKKFGEFLPRTGVYFLPDLKVLDLLKLLNDYRMQCQKTGKYGDADKARNKFALVRDRNLCMLASRARNREIAQQHEGCARAGAADRRERSKSIVCGVQQGMGRLHDRLRNYCLSQT